MLFSAALPKVQNLLVVSLTLSADNQVVLIAQLTPCLLKLASTSGQQSEGYSESLGVYLGFK
jgi:hypothetical protein